MMLCDACGKKIKDNASYEIEGYDLCLKCSIETEKLIINFIKNHEKINKPKEE